MLGRLSQIKGLRFWMLGILGVLLVAMGMGRGPAYAPAEWDGNVASSQTLGFRFTLPEGWAVFTQEEIDAMNAGALADAGQERTRVQDEFYVYDPASGASLSVQSQKGKGDVEALLEDALEQLRGLPGVRAGRMEARSVAGAEYGVVHAAWEREGYEQYLLMRAQGRYLVTISLTQRAGEDHLAVLDAFAPWDGPG